MYTRDNHFIDYDNISFTSDICNIRKLKETAFKLITKD